MQRDTDFTIGDIVPSLEFSAFGDTSRREVRREISSDLRFLKIPPHVKTNIDVSQGVTCELTEKGIHPGELNYVAVSYCWQSFATPGVDNTAPPTVQVRQDGTLRDPRCPPSVLLRAIAFALYQSISLIWIDQECVLQTDPADIQDHLQCNDVIFSQAKFKIGLLNFELTNQRQLDSLIDAQLALRIPESHSGILSRWGVDRILKEMRYLSRLLRAISRDRWFTRAWVYQERYSANIDMALLLPVRFQPSRDTDLVGTDFALRVEEICSMGVIWKQHFSDPQLDHQREEEAITVDTIHSSVVSLHDSAQLLSPPIFSGVPLDRIWPPRGHADPQQEIGRVRNFQIHQAFLGIERCDCSVFADRLTILSNVLRFKWTLQVPTVSFSSYSFSLLALLVANDHFPAVLIRTNDQVAPEFFGRPVSAMDLIVNACNLKVLVTEGKASQSELDNVSGILEDVFRKNITGLDAVEELMLDLHKDGHQDPPEYLSALEIGHIKSVRVVPLSSTIVEVLEGILPVQHVDNVGADRSHGEAVTAHGIRTNQLRRGDTFMAFDGFYHWRPEFVGKAFD